ncbi:DUF6098 family protein [Streptomyces fulvorobeus]|nr:DUF6098 family protein [Streptomyces fulvorobeus]NYE39179.1 hypothetical protein [Streptomyces fulvorobeus]
MPVFGTLDALAELVASRRGLYVRWSLGPELDLQSVCSRDALTGVPLPGLSANALDIEEWWGERPVRIWVARRLYDYSHLQRVRHHLTRPWVLHGSEAGRGPDNEPLVHRVEPLGWIGPRAITEADEVITHQPGPWGPMLRNDSA